MTYQELVELLKMKQASPQGAAPSLNDIIAGIQGQYQPMQDMPMQSLGQGAQRFTTGAQNFGPVEQITEYGRQPVSQSATPMTSYVPGTFDINKTYYIPEPTAQQVAARLSGDTGGNTGGTPLSAMQEAVFDFLNTDAGASYKNDLGKANNALIGSFVNGVVPGVGLANMLAGNKLTNPITAFKDAMSAYDKAQAAMQANLTNYGVTSKAMGPPTAVQMAALMAALSGDSGGGYGTTGPGSAAGIGVGSTSGINAMDAMSDSYSSGGGYSSDQGGGGWGGNDSGYSDGVGGVY